MAGERPSKKRRISNDSENVVSARSADDLYEWTQFRQSTGPEVLKGLNNFKDYLITLSQSTNASTSSKQFEILKQYCQWEKAPSDSEPEFPDLLSTWSFALDNNDEAVASILPAILAQFLRTISGVLDLRSSGLALIDSLLRRDRSKYFDKSFVSARNKSHLAQPCVELLTEMLEFDAGARAFEFWLRRDVVLPKLEAFLDQRNTKPVDGENSGPSLRHTSLHLVLAMLKYVSSNGKTDLLLQNRALHGVMSGKLNDDPHTLVQILQSLKRQLVDDAKVSREAIRSFFSSQRLELLARLYNNEADGRSRENIREALQHLLIEICTTERGVVVPASLKTSHLDFVHQKVDKDCIDLGLDSPYAEQSQTPVLTGAEKEMSHFANKLQPFDDELQSELLLKIFQSWPALLIPFTSKLQKFVEPDAEDPKWRAQFAFAYSLVEASSDISRTSTETSTEQAAETVFPHPLDRNYLNKLLRSDDPVLRISGARLLTVALQRLSKLLDSFNKVSRNTLDLQKMEKITSICEQRIPSARDVSLALQQTNMDDQNTFGTMLECLRTYYQVLPESARSSFDIGPIMSELCSRAESRKVDRENMIEHLAACAEIADLSPGTKWLHKPNANVLSPLARLLKVSLAGQSLNTKNRPSVVGKVLAQRGILNNASSSFAALRNSLLPAAKFEATDDMYLFLDNCLGRAAQKPVRYLDTIETAAQIVSDQKPLSLLVATIAEQWQPYTTSHCDGKSEVKAIAAWIARFFVLLEIAGENYRVMAHCLETCVSKSEKNGKYLSEAMVKAKKRLTTDNILETTAHQVDTDMVDIDTPSAEDHSPSIPDDQNPEIIAKSIITIPDSLEGLEKWSSMDIDIEFQVETKRFERLLLCTASTDDEVRLQAYQTLQGVVHTIDSTSQHAEKQRIWLVLSELMETMTKQGSSQPLPSILPLLASRLLEIMLDPTHALYVKANKYLLSRPYWSGKRVISFWLDRILYQQPTNDDKESGVVELSWLLSLLLGGLQTQLDLDLYRRLSVWERVASLYSSPVLRDADKRLILAMIWRATDIERGTVVLWTRFGIDAWLSLLSITDTSNQAGIAVLREKMARVHDEVQAWEVACALTKPGDH